MTTLRNVAIAFVVLIGLASLAVMRMDQWLTAETKRHAAELSTELKRPVDVDSVAMKLWGGLGVEVSGLTIGKRDNEPENLLSVTRVAINADLLKAVRSRGHNLHVTSIEVTNPQFALIQRPGGETNVGDLLLQFNATKNDADAKAPSEEESAGDFSVSELAVDRIALTNGKVELIDLTGGSPKAVGASQINLTINDAAMGRSLHAVLDAAVLGETKNLSVEIDTKAIDRTFRVTPVDLKIDLSPVSLAPISAFVTDLHGLTHGTFESHLNVHLGAAMPGGQGPTVLDGTMIAQGLRFKDSARATTGDFAAKLKIAADVAKGNLHIDTLDVQMGQLQISGKGRATGLFTSAPSLSSLEVVGRNVDLDTLGRYYPPLESLVQKRIGGPFDFSVRGGGTATSPKLKIELDLTRTAIVWPGQFLKAKGVALVVESTIDATSSTVGARTLHSRWAIQLADQRAAGSFDMSVDSTSSKPTTTFDIVIESNALDIDRLMPTDAKPDTVKGAAERPVQVAETVVDPHRYDGYRGQLRMNVASLRIAEKTLNQFDSEIAMIDDSISVVKLTSQAFGGNIDASGSSVKLGPKRMPVELKLKTQNLDVRSLFASAGKPAPIAGKLSGNFLLRGEGIRFDELRTSLSGDISGSIDAVTWGAFDPFGEILKPLARALPFPQAGKVADRLGRQIARIPYGLEIEAGTARLKQPIIVRSQDDVATLRGGIQLTGELALQGEFQLSASTASHLCGNQLRLDAPIAVPFGLVGPIWRPELVNVDLKPAVAQIVKSAGGSIARKLLGKNAEAIESIVDNPQAAAKARLEQEQAAAQAKLAEERTRLENEARQKTEKARRELEEAAKSKLKGLFGR